MVKVKLEKEQVLLQKHVNIEGMLMVSRGGGREGRREGGEEGGRGGKGVVLLRLCNGD